jgi:hypothetical protein
MAPIGKLFGGGSKPAPVQAITPPSVRAEPEPAAGGEDKEKLRRVGRAALIQTSTQGVLGQAQTGRKKLLAL